jgi:hypothetical protein
MSSKNIEILLTETFKKNFKSLRKKYILMKYPIVGITIELKTISLFSIMISSILPLLLS